MSNTNNTALQLSDNSMSDWRMIQEQAGILIKTGFLPKSITSPQNAPGVVGLASVPSEPKKRKPFDGKFPAEGELKFGRSPVV